MIRLTKIFFILVVALVLYINVFAKMGVKENEDNTNKVILKAEQNYNNESHDVVVDDSLEKEDNQDVQTESNVAEVKKESVTEEEKAVLNAFYKENNEFIGLLKSDLITLPIYKTANNKKYLKIGQDGKSKNSAGAIFEDTRSTENDLVFWGHHMKSGMFKFVDQMATNKDIFDSMKSSFVFYSFKDGKAEKYQLNAMYALTGVDTGEVDRDFPLSKNFLDNKEVTQGEVSEASNQLVMGTCNYSYTKKAHAYVVFNMTIAD
jgi:hypothetical protein